jgi:transcriptional regulator with XRE-family HTH domain
MERTKTRTKAPDARDVDVGRRIRAQRLVCRMSQTELANNLGVTFQQVQKYEKGVNRVGAGRLSRIADVLSVPVAFFFSGDMTPTQSDGASTGLSFLETAGAVRLVRAYSQIEDPQIRRALVDLAEEIGGSRGGRDTGRHVAAASDARKRARKDGRRARLS